MVTLGIFVTMGSFVLMMTVSRWLAGLIVTVVILDGGLQGWNISLQAIIQNLTDEARSRVTAIYIFLYFVGGSLGSITGSAVYQYSGFVAVAGCGLGGVALAMILHFGTQIDWCVKKSAADEGQNEAYNDLKEALDA
jgi:predicted MFS family arabinose efflux permease